MGQFVFVFLRIAVNHEENEEHANKDSYEAGKENRDNLGYLPEAVALVRLLNHTKIVWLLSKRRCYLQPSS